MFSESGLFGVEGASAVGLDVPKGRGALVGGCCGEGADEGGGRGSGVVGEESSG